MDQAAWVAGAGKMSFWAFANENPLAALGIVTVCAAMVVLVFPAILEFWKILISPDWHIELQMRREDEDDIDDEAEEEEDDEEEK